MATKRSFSNGSDNKDRGGGKGRVIKDKIFFPSAKVPTIATAIKLEGWVVEALMALPLIYIFFAAASLTKDRDWNKDCVWVDTKIHGPL